MANTKTTPHAAPPDWRQREHNRRMNRVLILVVLLMALIAFYYYLSFLGNVGPISGLAFDTTDHIAFVRQDDKGATTLFAVRADGTDLRQLTPNDDVSNKAQPVWERDGKSLLYASNLRDNKVTQIYILGTGGPKQLTYGPGNKSAPAVSFDGKLAAFIVQGSVKTVNLNGTDVFQVMPPPTAAKEGGDDVKPGQVDLEGPFLMAGFSSDSMGLAAIQDVSGQHHPIDGMGVFDQALMVLPNNATKMLPVAFGHEVDFAWEPNGSRLACSYTELEATGRQGKLETVSGIQIISFKDPNKPELVPLFAGVGYSIEPKHIAWSPDGSKMAFEAWHLKGEGIRELLGIVVMNTTLDSSMPQGMKVGPADVHTVPCMIPVGKDGLPQTPRWSPDSSRMLYEMQRPDAKRDLWVINSDGTNKINLTQGKGDNFDGVWSPALRKP